MNNEENERLLLNPFENVGDAFAGRMPELDWIADGMAKGAHLLLQGAEGMGKTTLIEKAAEWLAQKSGGQLLRVDASSKPEEIGHILHSWAEKREREMLPDRGLGQVPISHEQRPAEVLPPAKEEDVFSALSRLNRIAERSIDPLGVCFDNFQQGAELAAHPLQHAITQALRGLPKLGLIVATAEKNLPFADGLTARVLGPVEPAALAKSIDERFGVLASPGANIGEKCVELGGPRTSEIIGLARQTFDLGAKKGTATTETVQAAAQESVQKKASSFAQFWQHLPETERTLLQQIAHTAHELCTPQHLTEMAAASRTVASLVGKGALGELPLGALFFLDSAFKNWVGETSMHLEASASIPPTGPKTFQFNFGLNASARRLQPSH